MLVENKFKKWYDNIIKNAKSQNRSKKENYFEKHHILPKSLGGTDCHDNLVLLTAREHYVCHKLLIKFTTMEYKKKMVCALWAFNRKSKNQQRQVLTSRDYESVRRQVSENFSKDRKGIKKSSLTDSHKKKISQALKGTKKSEKTKERMKESWKNRPPRSKEHCEALSRANAGRKAKDSTRKKMSESKKGINPVHTQISWQCNQCGKIGIGISNYNRWHGDNCRKHNVK